MANGRRFGTFTCGIFEGIDDSREGFPKFVVRVEDREGGFVENFDFSPFDPATGASNVPEGLAVGDYVEVRTRITAKPWFDPKANRQSAFATRQILGVEVPKW